MSRGLWWIITAIMLVVFMPIGILLLGIVILREIFFMLNGDVEDNPDLVNEEAYQDGWCMIVRPHEWDADMYLDQSEYIDYLNEL